MQGHASPLFFSHLHNSSSGDPARALVHAVTAQEAVDGGDAGWVVGLVFNSAEGAGAVAGGDRWQENVTEAAWASSYHHTYDENT